MTGTQRSQSLSSPFSFQHLMKNQGLTVGFRRKSGTTFTSILSVVCQLLWLSPTSSQHKMTIMDGLKRSIANYLGDNESVSFEE